MVTVCCKREGEGGAGLMGLKSKPKGGQALSSGGEGGGREKGREGEDYD